MNQKNRKVIYQGKYLRYVTLGHYEFVEHFSCSGVAVIIPVTEDKRLIFVEQFRIPVNRYVVEFPAGLIGDLKENKEESVLVAARRELLEETGYDSSDLTVLASGPDSSGALSNIVTFVQALGVQKVAEGGGDDTESIIVHTVGFNEVDKWLAKRVAEGKFVDPKVYAGLYMISISH